MKKFPSLVAAILLTASLANADSSIEGKLKKGDPIPIPKSEQCNEIHLKSRDIKIYCNEKGEKVMERHYNKNEELISVQIYKDGWLCYVDYLGKDKKGPDGKIDIVSH